MGNIRIGYVILHFQALETTIGCIESVKKIQEENDVIVVVDNNSPNGSGIALYEKYKDANNIIVRLNEENLGFARGNNVGFCIAKKEYDCDFIVLLNNDTIMIQDDFRLKIIDIYNREHYAVLGPMIILKNDKVDSSNPSIPKHTTLLRTRIGQISNYVRLILSYLNLDIALSNLIDKGNKSSDFCMSTHCDVSLSGCCWIFSSEYIHRFDGINDNTFMYLEEILLYIRIKSMNMKILYCPEIQIKHLEDMSTNSIFAKNKDSRRFKYKCQAKSFRVVAKELKKKQAW